MSQNPVGLNLQNPTTKGLVAGSTDGSGLSQLIGQGLSTKLNFTTAANIKVGAGRVVRIIATVAGTGALTINDCATTGAATTANQIFTQTAATALGQIFTIDAPFTVGLTISAVPASSTLVIVYT